MSPSLGPASRKRGSPCLVGTFGPSSGGAQGRRRSLATGRWPGYDSSSTLPRSCVALNELSLVDFAEAADPFALFELWLAEAAASEINDPEAMALATVDADGLPDARMVLCKGADARGLVFYSNVESAKGRELERQPEGGGAVPLEVASPPGPVPRRGGRIDGRPKATPISRRGRGGARSALGRASSRGRSSRAPLWRRRSRLTNGGLEAPRSRGPTIGGAIVWSRSRSSSGSTARRDCTSGFSSSAIVLGRHGKNGCFIRRDYVIFHSRSMISKSPPNLSKLGRSQPKPQQNFSKGRSLDFHGFHFFVRNEAFSMGYRDPLGIKSFSWLSLPIKRSRVV